MKKLLSIIAAGTLVTTAGSTLVSCGMSASKLMARKVNTKEYKGFMTAALNTWSPGSSNQNSDAIVLENLYDGLLTPNAHGEIEGQMADWWGHNEEGTEYYFHLRDKEIISADGRKTGIPKWTITKNGKITGTKDVSPMNFFNAFRFTFNPNASADGAAPTNGLFKNGSALVNSILPTITEYDTLLNDGKNFGRTTNNGGEENIKQEYISTRNFDIIIMLVNLWSATTDGQDRINKLASAEIVEIVDENGKPTGTYNRTKEFDDLISEIKNYTPEEKFQKLIVDSSQNGGMMAVSVEPNGLGTATSPEKANSEQMYNIKYTLENASTSFFTSAIGYGSLKPLPDYAVSYSDDQNRSWYNFSKRYQPSINEMWFSGAYYVKSYKAATNAVLLKNPHYYQADRTYIEKATYTLTRTASVDSNRLWFEGGDASEVAISPNDDSGWKKYVGDDYNSDEQKFAFEGTHATSTVPSQYSFTTFYNYGRVNAEKKEISKSSLALAQKSVRLYLNYFMQRTQFPAYVAGKLDNSENTKESLAWDANKDVKTRSSTLLRNIFTIPNLAINPDEEENTLSAPKEIRGVSVKDYTIQNVGADYNKMYGTKNMELEPSPTSPIDKSSNANRLSILEENIAKTVPNFDKETLESFYNEQFGSLVDGNDAFYQNDLMALGMFFESDGTTVKEGLQTQLENFSKVAYNSVIDRSQNSKSIDQAHEKAKAEILGDIVRQDLENKKIIKEGETVTLEWLLNGVSRLTLNPRVEYIVDQFNNTVGNSSPIKLATKVSNDNANYIDMSKKGDYDIFVSGWGPDYTDPYNFLHTLIYGGEYDAYTRLTNVVKSNGTNRSNNVPNLTMEADYKDYETVYKDLIDYVAKYTGIVETAKGESDFTQRLIQLSEAEAYALYNVGFTAPLYNKTPMKTIQLSYLDPFTRSSFIAGSSNLRLFGVKMIESLWNKEEFLAAQTQFDEGSNNSVEEYKKLYVYDLNSNGIVTVKSK